MDMSPDIWHVAPVSIMMVLETRECCEDKDWGESVISGGHGGTSGGGGWVMSGGHGGTAGGGGGEGGDGVSCEGEDG